MRTKALALHGTPFSFPPLEAWYRFAKPQAVARQNQSVTRDVWTKNFKSESLFEQKKPGGSRSAWYTTASWGVGSADFFSSLRYFTVSGFSVMSLRVEKDTVFFKKI